LVSWFSAPQRLVSAGSLTICGSPLRPVATVHDRCSTGAKRGFATSHDWLFDPVASLHQFKIFEILYWIRFTFQSPTKGGSLIGFPVPLSPHPCYSLRGWLGSLVSISPDWFSDHKSSQPVHFVHELPETVHPGANLATLLWDVRCLVLAATVAAVHFERRHLTMFNAWCALLGHWISQAWWLTVYHTSVLMWC
jgi:hypothetical protein